MLPSRKDISLTNGQNLDERAAIEHFLGKSVTEACAMFQENPLYYASDLIWMGSPAFRYYFPAFNAYLRSPSAALDADALNHLATLVEVRLSLSRTEKQSLAANSDVVSALAYCLENFGKFAVSESFYPKLRATLIELHRALGTSFQEP